MKVPSEILDLFKEIGTSINVLVEDPNVLGEPWRSQLLEIKGQINASLRDLPDTDRVPAAQAAAGGLDYLKSQLLCVGHIISALSGIVKSNSEKTTTAMAGITPEVERQVAAKLAAGDYLAKADAESLAGNARQEGDLAGFARGKQLADRRSALAVAGLPAEVAAAAPEPVLLAKDEDFNTAREQAKARVAKLQAVGLSATSLSFNSLPWAPEADFTAQHATFEAIAKAAKPATAPPATETASSTKPSGFIGGNQAPSSVRFLC